MGRHYHHYRPKNKWLLGAAVKDALGATPMKTSQPWDNSVTAVKVLPAVPLSMGVTGHNSKHFM